PDTPNRITPTLSYGAKVKLELNLDQNFDLDRREADDLSTVRPSVELAFTFQPHEQFEAFVNFELKREIAVTEEDGDSDRPTQLDLDQAYFMVENLVDDLTLQVGRQEFDDDREWLYDQEIDAVRVFYELFDVDIELSASREQIVDRDLLNLDRGNRINNYIAYAEYELVDDDDGHRFLEEVNLAAYAIFRDDREDDDNDPLFLGVRSIGEFLDGLEYWADFGLVRGRDGSEHIRAYGFDVGGTYEFDLEYEPYVTLGYAFGSGDGNPDDGTDREFRQTGLHDNSGKFGGVTSFGYYGELFDPELSNMSILTAGVGLRPLENTSLDLVYHRYWQDELDDELRDVKVEEDLTGSHKALGEEVDLVFGYSSDSGLSFELVLGYFRPGRAYEHRDDALFVNSELTYEF
ncbi:MAG: alginate export family protein, partial [Gammaproteobacteria bacterium]